MSKSLEIAEDKFIKISWGAIAAIFVAIFGFGAWMTSQELRAQTNTDEITKIHASQNDVGDMLNKIDKRLSRIEFLLERKHSRGD